MSSFATNFCILNESDYDIITTQVDQIDNFDWDGVSRPDHNFQDVAIHAGYRLCEREEVNRWTTGAWFRIKLVFNNCEWVRFRVDQLDAEEFDIDRYYPCEGPASKYIKIRQQAGNHYNTMIIMKM